SEHGAHVVNTHHVFSCQLAQHPQRCPEWLLNRCSFKIGKHCGNLSFIVICPGRSRSMCPNAKCTVVHLRDKRSHQPAVSNRPRRGSTHRFMGGLNRTIETGAVKDQLSRVRERLTRYHANQCKQYFRSQAIATIENLEAHTHSLAS